MRERTAVAPGVQIAFDPSRIAVVFSGGGTGGHLYPALALAEALQEVRPRVRSVFVGSVRGIEARVLPAREVEHLLLPVEGFRRDHPLRNLPVLAALARALARVADLFRRLRPALVVVTGGYAGGPAGIVAGLLGIRLVVQEQNAEPGITTRVLSRWATETYLAFPEARGRLPRGARARARMAGNPVRPPEPIDRRAAAHAFGLSPERPVVLVVGGSQGAQPLNEAVLELVRGIESGALAPLPEAQLLWATGPAHIAAVREALDLLAQPAWVRATGYIEAMSSALALTDLAVSRAGAMATSEFLAWGIPSVLVPLPSAAADHQTRNARALEASGAARWLPQDQLSAVRLHGALVELLAEPNGLRAMARAAQLRGRPLAAREMAERLARLLPPDRPLRAETDPRASSAVAGTEEDA